MVSRKGELAVGSSICECAYCLEQFTSVTAFDMHLIGKGTGNIKCMTAKQMQAKGMTIGSRGWWTTGRERQIAGAA